MQKQNINETMCNKWGNKEAPWLKVMPNRNITLFAKIGSQFTYTACRGLKESDSAKIKSLWLAI